MATYKDVEERSGENGRFYSREAMEEGLERARERWNAVSRGLLSFIRERPGTTLVIALGAGYLFGRMMRRS